VAIRAGQLLDDTFRIVDCLGRGAFAEVWTATREADGAKVAIKMLLPEALGNQDAVERFRREAWALSQIKSEHVCRVLVDRTALDDAPYFALERLDGETLAERLERDGALSFDELEPVLDGVLSALVAAHAAGFVHRDLKPSNVFLERADDAVRARLLDFGV
jgi:eukaryotic-like serine/threonine-protein kinase